MKFSVVIPLYNKAAYIGCTIESVLAQSFTDFEIVVVDDGSSDGSAELVTALADPRIRLVRQANAGVSAARNRGIAAARGEWVALLDADDWHHPRHLACLVQAQQAWPRADAVATEFVPVADAHGPWPPVWPACAETPHVELITDLPTRWMSGPTVCSSSIAVRTERLQRMQPCFPVGESLGEDIDLWFRLAEQTSIALVHAPMVAYRVGLEDSLTAQHAGLRLPHSVQRMQARALSGEMTAAQRKSALWFIAQHNLSLARLALASGERRQGLHWLMQARHAASGKRWWLTAVMVCLCPRQVVTSWERWRVGRKFFRVDTADAGR